MQVHLRSCRDTAVIVMDGRLSHDTSHKMYQAIESALRARCRTIVLSLGKCELIVSTGIRLFIDIHDRMAESDGRMILTDVPKDVAFGLQAALVADFFTVVSSLPKALDKLGISPEALHLGLPRPEEVQSVSSAAPAPDPQKASTQELRDLIRQCFPGRLAVEIVEWFVRNNHSLATPESIAKALDEDPRAVRRMLQELELRGVLRSQYLFSPGAALKTRITGFLDLLEAKRKRDASRKPGESSAIMPAIPPAMVKAAEEQAAQKDAASEPEPEPAPEPEPKPEPVPEPEPPPRRGTGVYRQEQEEASKPETPLPMTDEQLQKVVTRYLPGRLAVDIVSWYILHNNDLGDAKKIATALRGKEKDVHRKMAELTKRGVLKKLGGDQFNYAPEPAVDAQLREFLDRWQRKDEHARLFAWVIAQEG